MEQARHGVAANALSFGKHFLCIAKVNGHCSAEMITRVYSRYIDARRTGDSASPTNAYRGLQGNKREA
jgi:hypothetical protein